MPYFVFRITPEQESTLIGTHDKYQDAKKEVRDLRTAAHTAGDQNSFRLVFAKDAREAKRLITAKRQMASPLEEWEEKA